MEFIHTCFGCASDDAYMHKHKRNALEQVTKQQRVAAFKEADGEPATTVTLDRIANQVCDEVARSYEGQPYRAIYFPSAEPPTRFTEQRALTLSALHITIAGCHCGDAACKVCDPSDRMVDGLTVRECLERYEAWQREDLTRLREFQAPGRSLSPTPTAAQKEAARLEWSRQLRLRQEQAREAERVVVTVDGGGE